MTQDSDEFNFEAEQRLDRLNKSTERKKLDKENKTSQTIRKNSEPIALTPSDFEPEDFASPEPVIFLYLGAHACSSISVESSMLLDT